MPRELSLSWGYGSAPFHLFTPISHLLSHWHPSLQQLQPAPSSLLVYLHGNPSLFLHMTVPPPLLETQFSITSALYTQLAVLWSCTVPDVHRYRGAHHSEKLVL